MENRWTVTWDTRALAQLATLYNDAPAGSDEYVAGQPSKRQITDSSNDIDKNLNADPYETGEVDPSGLGIGFEGCLRFQYSVAAADRKVEVLDVALRRRK